jgi:predicted nucleic acid-binding protein
LILYLDTSSLLKIFLIEPDSETVRRLVDPAERVISSLVAYPEARAGLARARRNGRIDDAGYDDIVAQFEVFWGECQHVDVTADVARLAGDLAERHALRGFDAIHLASAISFHDASGEALTFLAADALLLQAAAVCGLETA